MKDLEYSGFADFLQLTKRELVPKLKLKTLCQGISNVYGVSGETVALVREKGDRTIILLNYDFVGDSEGLISATEKKIEDLIKSANSYYVETQIYNIPDNPDGSKVVRGQHPIT